MCGQEFYSSTISRCYGYYAALMPRAMCASQPLLLHARQNWQGVEDSMSNQARLLEASRDRRRAAEETREAVAEEKKRFLKGERDLAEACMKHEGLKAHLSLMRR